MMLSLISTLGGLFLSGLPKLMEFFQNRADHKQELELARLQNERDLKMAAQGLAAQQRIEEIRTEQVSIASESKMTEAALAHDQKVLDKASKWVANYVGTVRPTITYIFVLELVAINIWIAWYVWATPGMVHNMDDLIRLSDIIFSEDEMAMLSGIIGFWFGSRNWNKK